MRVADCVCDVDSKFNLCVATITGNGIQNTCFLVPILQTNFSFTAYSISLIYFRLLKEYLVSKKILRQSEANVTENRGRHAALVRSHMSG